MTIIGRKNPKAEAARQQYILDPEFPTLRELSKAHDVSYHTLTSRCAREGWLDQREEYHDQVATESLHRAMREASKKKAATIKRLDTLTDAVMGDFDGRLKVKARYREAVERWNILPAESKTNAPFPDPPEEIFNATPHDLDKMIRLMQFMVGDPDSRLEITGEVKIQITLVVQKVVEAIRKHEPDPHIRGLIIGELKHVLEEQNAGQN
jgi:hypothetical protein